MRRCDRHEAGHAAALGVFAAHGVAGALRRHHDDVDAGLRLDQAEMHVQAVGKGDRRALAQVVMDVFAVGLGLKLVGHGEHDQVAPGGGLGDAHDLQALALGLGGAGEPSRRATTTFLAPLNRAGSARGHGPGEP
jgi:hypothetical protein